VDGGKHFRRALDGGKNGIDGTQEFGAESCALVLIPIVCRSEIGRGS
jgi:hypothetical protein